jgi:hypothetical protein
MSENEASGIVHPSDGIHSRDGRGRKIEEREQNPKSKPLNKLPIDSTTGLAAWAGSIPNLLRTLV